jgi:cytochrome b subunit of formate dehydrogenase
MLSTTLLLAIICQIEGEPRLDVPVADDVNTCVLCHSTPEFWAGKQATYYIPPDGLANDVHYQRGVKCHECHGGNPTALDISAAHASEDITGSLVPFGGITKSCGRCHESQLAGLSQGVHKSVLQGSGGANELMSCKTCHSDRGHAILPVEHPDSPVYLGNQVNTCKGCHEAEFSDYRKSGHGHGLFESGLASAACADCHGAHGIYRAANENSTLHVTNVADTCAKCHRLIQERLNLSIHGRGEGPGRNAYVVAPGGDTHRRPSCTDCHVGHDLPDPRSSASRQQQANRCGECHTDLQTAYQLSMHGELSDLGYTAGAKCADCHGAHDILPLSDPNGKMSLGNRIATCASCHPGISENLASFDPHANHRDRERSALVFWTYRGVLTFIIVVFGVFGIHSILWFFRTVLDVLTHGRPPALAPNAPGYTRFSRFHRVSHTVMVISFLGLALTGLPLKFSSYQWAQWLAALLGGFSSTGFWHRVFSITTFGCFAAYVIHLGRMYRLMRRNGATRLGTIFGPDSPVPNFRDAKDALAMVKWFAGLGPRPTFERWAYWEKFDFFGASSDIILIGTSGLILWFPDWFCTFLPGEAVNVAKVVHSTLALLATGFVFAIHFFGTHLRADKFPMDMSILTGVVSETEMHHERPDLLARLQAEGREEEMRANAPERLKLCIMRIAGFVALFLGLAALAGIIWSLLV